MCVRLSMSSSFYPKLILCAATVVITNMYHTNLILNAYLQSR